MVEQRSPKPQVAGSSPVFPAKPVKGHKYITMDNIRLYIKESIHELLNNVTWPTWGELISHTRIELVATAIFALVTFLMDSVANKALSLIYGLGS